MDITCDLRLFICILLLFPLAFISKITSDPIRIHHRQSQGSLKLSTDVIDNPWKKQLGKRSTPHQLKVRKSSVEEILPPLESSIVPSSESELKIPPVPKLWLSLLSNLLHDLLDIGDVVLWPDLHSVDDFVDSVFSFYWITNSRANDNRCFICKYHPEGTN